jgi:phosphoglycerate dehydrogenase-like enzyme
MIGAEELALMKRGAILINTSRGLVVNEKALLEALQSDHLAAAGLDVFEDEPLHADSPLLKMGHKVLLSPHMASSNLDNGLKQGIAWANRAVLAALKGEVPEHVYNKAVIPKWLKRYGGHKV